MPNATNPPGLKRHTVTELITRLNDPQYQRWAQQVRSTGGCSQPIHLKGRVDYTDPATGHLLHRYTTLNEPGGTLRVACKTRRASRCPTCAETYRADTYQLIRAGLTGGKGVPDTVRQHPAIFLTLTAPSYGTVHTHREHGGKTLPCHPRRDAPSCPHGQSMSCTTRHNNNDPRLGTPLCAGCYDYTGTVLFNALAPELWRRFTITLRRSLARAAGLTVKDLAQHLKVSFAKVAEYQRRGIVHFHAIIRLDGPNGPTTSPPGWATLDQLTTAIDQAASQVSVRTPAADGLTPLTLRWGAQLDIRPIHTSGELTEEAVAGYVAKYATKAAETVGTLDRRIRPTDNLDQLGITGHPRRLIEECLHLGELPELADLRLTAWAHMLGFRGHFSTKSRAYSTTLAALRQARADHRNGEAITTGRLPLFDEDTVLITAHWHYTGRGHTTGENLLTQAMTAHTTPTQYSAPQGAAA